MIGRRVLLYPNLGRWIDLYDTPPAFASFMFDVLDDKPIVPPEEGARCRA